MLLDTGAGLTVIDSLLKDSIGPEVEDRRVTMLGGTQRIMKCYEGPSLKIGTILDERPKVMVSDLRMMVRFVGKPIVGVLAMDVMQRGKILLNYDDRTLKIHAGSWILDGPDIKEVELNKEADVPELHEEIGGHSVLFGVDTGSNHCIILESTVFDALVSDGVIELSKITARQMAGGGVSSAKQGWFLKGELMGKNLGGVAVSSDPRSSILGLEWLYAFNTEIDFSTRKLRYHLRRNAKLPCDTQIMIGAILLFDEYGAVVERLRPGSGAAENAGIKPGDVIQEFASLKGKEMNEATIAETVSDEAGKEISVRYLRKADGKQVSVKLRLPPVISDWDFGGRDIFNGK